MNDNNDAILQAINAAESVEPILAGLVERYHNDPRVLFEAHVLAELLELRNRDRGAFEQIRADLKSAGCRMAALDEALAEHGGSRGSGRSSQADTLIAIAEQAVLFHTPDGRPMPISRSTAIARPGRSAPRGSGAG